MYKQRKILNSLLRVLFDKGLFNVVPAYSPNLLTVLNYHRINDINQGNFTSYKPNVSATQVEFAKQMEHIKKNYNLINCEHLIAWLYGKRELPQRAALITFDDGYQDNLGNAYPILNALDIPAVIFITTDFIGSKTPFYWDFVAYSFSQTNKDCVNLPLLGNVKWTNVNERDNVLHRWITVLKKVPDVQKQECIGQLTNLLEVAIEEDAFMGLYLNWDQVRQLSRDGIEFGSHTASHPILTRVDSAHVRTELKKSKDRIEEEIGKPVIAFAYPNGQKDDYSQEIINQVRELGMNIAFSLLPGPTRYSNVRKNPFAIRRISIGNNDIFPRFIAKLSGMSRLAIVKRYL